MKVWDLPVSSRRGTWDRDAVEVAHGLARRMCVHCARGVPHHTNSVTSIGGSDRRPVWDLHAVEDASGVGLQECLAGDLWFLLEEMGVVL